MTKKIVVITTKHLHSFMDEMFSKMHLDCEVNVLEYTNFKNISEIYTSLESEVDGFMVSGAVAKGAIEKVVKNPKKPIVSVGVDTAGLYRILLEQLVKNRNMDINRVIMDFLIPIRKNTSCSDLFENEKLALIGKDIEKWIENSTLEDLYSFENKASEKIIEFWSQKKMDLVVCCFSSIMPILKENGIPCIFAYPSSELLSETLGILLSYIKINHMREGLPVVVSVGKKSIKNTDDLDIDTISLQKCLLNFNKEKLTGFLVQKSNDGFDIYTSLRVATHITNFFQDCQLSQYLSDHLDFKVCVGYGVGNNIAQAKNNASDAKKEAILSGNSFVMDEKQNLIGPLNTDQFLEITNEITPEIDRIAKQSKLSTLTIQKLVTIMKIIGTNQLTTRELAAKLGVTVRNANRILSNLETGGLASELYNKSSNSKGRPVKVYKITFPI